MELNDAPEPVIKTHGVKKLSIHMLTKEQREYLNMRFGSEEPTGNLYLLANLGIFAMLDMYEDQLRKPDTTSREDHRKYLLNLLHKSGMRPAELHTYMVEIINGVDELVTELNKQAEELITKEGLN